MTSHLFATFSEASAFAKQVTLEHQAKASVARSTEGFIVVYTIPTIEEHERGLDFPVEKYAATSLEYNEWLKEQGIQRSEAAEEQWFEAYKAGMESKDYSTKDSAAERLVEFTSTPVGKLPVISLSGNANKNPENSNAEKSRQPSPCPEQQKRNDESKGQITKRDLKEFKEKLGRLIAEEDKKRKEKLLSDQKALEDRERNKAKKIKERDERLEADRIKRENVMSLHKPQTKRRAQKKITGTVLPDQESRRGTTICPRCGGDGGVNGGCAKCDGTGWV